MEVEESLSAAARFHLQDMEGTGARYSPVFSTEFLGYLTLAVLILHLFGWGKLWNIMKFMNCNLRNFQLRECSADRLDSVCWAGGEGGLAHGDGAGGGGR